MTCRRAMTLGATCLILTTALEAGLWWSMALGDANQVAALQDIKSKGVTIHTIDCDTLESFAETPERWLDVAWDQDPTSTEQHVGRLSVVITNQPGSLGSLTTVIGKNLGNISNLKITNRSIDFFEVLVDVEVKDVRHLTNIIAALRATPSISSVDRARG